jgi:hypothetical protein
MQCHVPLHSTRSTSERPHNHQRACGATSPRPPAPAAPQIPKTTRLSLQQAQREREQGVAMHRSFQRDLVKTRLAAARAYVKVLTDGQVSGPAQRGSRAAGGRARPCAWLRCC